MSFIQPTVSYINAAVPLTVAQVLASFPAGSTFAGKYANVTDLYNMGGSSGVVEVLRCRYDAANNLYRWVPQRQEYAAALASTGGTVTLMPLVTAPTIRLTGTLISTMTVTPSATNAWVGMRMRVVQNSTLGLFVANITGLLGSNLTLLGNAVKDLEYGPSGWFASS